MTWWSNIFRRKPKSRLYRLNYTVLFKLYSEDGKREVEVCEFENGEYYLAEREWVEGTTFKDRHAGSLVGPFTTAGAAEKFIVATAWFCGRDN